MRYGRRCWISLVPRRSCGSLGPGHSQRIRRRTQRALCRWPRRVESPSDHALGPQSRRCRLVTRRQAHRLRGEPATARETGPPSWSSTPTGALAHADARRGHHGASVHRGESKKASIRCGHPTAPRSCSATLSPRTTDRTWFAAHLSERHPPTLGVRHTRQRTPGRLGDRPAAMTIWRTTTLHDDARWGLNGSGAR